MSRMKDIYITAYELGIDPQEYLELFISKGEELADLAKEEPVPVQTPLDLIDKNLDADLIELPEQMK